MMFSKAWLKRERREYLNTFRIEARYFVVDEDGNEVSEPFETEELAREALRKAYDNA
jgi:hypothetical protein